MESNNNKKFKEFSYTAKALGVINKESNKNHENVTFENINQEESENDIIKVELDNDKDIIDFLFCTRKEYEKLEDAIKKATGKRLVEEEDDNNNLSSGTIKQNKEFKKLFSKLPKAINKNGKIKLESKSGKWTIDIAGEPKLIFGISEDGNITISRMANCNNNEFKYLISMHQINGIEASTIKNIKNLNKEETEEQIKKYKKLSNKIRNVKPNNKILNSLKNIDTKNQVGENPIGISSQHSNTRDNSRL